MTEMIRCSCGVAAKQPWRTRGTPYSPASFTLGVLWVGAGCESSCSSNPQSQLA
jgi:hypothetical protein